jgi:citronellol/citronellal dehydrogenase
MDLGLKDRVAIVTGGSRGIGRAIALGLAAEGCHLAICARGEEKLRETEAEIAATGVRAFAMPLDVTDGAAIDAFVARTASELGRIDVLVNNAGGQFVAPADQISPKGWRAVHRLNVDATWDLTRTVAERSMIPNRSGLVVFIGFSPRRGVPFMVHASAARAALENLAAGLAIEWSRYGIRAVCVACGAIDTEGFRGYGEAVVEEATRTVPLGRLGTPEEVASAIAFLSTPGGRYITGTTLVVDGGVDAWGLATPPPRA